MAAHGEEGEAYLRGELWLEGGAPEVRQLLGDETKEALSRCHLWMLST